MRKEKYKILNINNDIKIDESDRYVYLILFQLTVVIIITFLVNREKLNFYLYLGGILIMIVFLTSSAYGVVKLSNNIRALCKEKDKIESKGKIKKFVK